jgi:Protein of unknown function (DUF2630)
MSAFPGGEGPLSHEGQQHELSQIDVYSHVEGLCDEESALREVPHHERSPHQHARLQEIGEELNRIWGRLSDRAHHLGHHRAHRGDGHTS